MAASKFVIRFNSPSGQFTINTITENNTISDLKGIINQLTGIHLERIKIYSGFPPKPVINNDNTLLLDADIRSGDTLVIRSEDNKDVQVVPEVKQPPEINQVLVSEPQLTAATSGEVNYNAQLTAATSGEVNFNAHINNLDFSEGIMMRDEVPSDNSCLFNSLCCILNNGQINVENGYSLRQIVADKIRSDPINYNSALLDRNNEDYCTWILNPDNWGGAIELAILSEHFSIEICAIDVASSKMLKFGEGSNYKNRCLLLYDGVHYDPLILYCNDEKISIFDAMDQRPAEMAMELAREAKESRQFTDLCNFKLTCNVCQVKLRGQKEAQEHAIVTGHLGYGELD